MICCTSGISQDLACIHTHTLDIFALNIDMPEVLYDTVVEVNERVVLTSSAGINVQGVTGEAVTIIQPLDKVQVEKDLRIVYGSGIRSIAVCLMHSFTFREHEEDIRRIVCFCY